MHRKKIGIVCLFLLLQCFLLFKGSGIFGIILNPILFFIVSFAFPFFINYVDQVKYVSNDPTINYPQSKGNLQGLLYALLGVFSVVCSFEEIRKLFKKFPLPTPNSDIFQQLDMLYDRFTQGVFPYAPVETVFYKPYPVYLPMHWLPIGISRYLHLDTRWSAFFILALVVGIFAFYVGKQVLPWFQKVFIIALPSLTIWVFILFGGEDLIVSFEVLIMAYYFLLATGFIFKNNSLIILGLILCLLSRYTLIFWTPLLAIIFLVNFPLKKNIVYAFLVISAIAVIYIIPFILKDPSIFAKGIRYHNGCCVSEIDNGFYTSFNGVHFAYLLHLIPTKNTEASVFMMRCVQAIALLSMLGLGLFTYFKRKSHPNLYVHLLHYLYLFVLVFFCFSPLTYRYYLSVLLILSIAVCLQWIINLKKVP
ncbi:MAG TPA: hypothetical protein PLU10_02245 [Chitinophagaceae bacterium]|nr:hypothetical protein [Chitinophagaceae bacterium]